MQMEAAEMTRSVTEEFLRRLGAGDHAGVAELFADGCDWQLSWPDEELGGPVPWIRDRRTREDIADHFRALAEHNEPHDGGTTIERVLVDGNDAVVLGTIRNTIRSTGRPYRAAVALHLSIEEGLVRRYGVYEDSLSVARAWHGDVREVSHT